MPDGSTLDVADGATTADVAARIGPGLARAAVAGRVTRDGESQVIDLKTPLPGDCELKILTASDDDADSLFVLRHSTAHVMAEAVCKLFPETKLVYGPPLEDGFYYDIDLSRSITPDDFTRIEAEMSRIIQEDRKFCRYEIPRRDAMTKLAGAPTINGQAIGKDLYGQVGETLKHAGSLHPVYFGGLDDAMRKEVNTVANLLASVK